MQYLNELQNTLLAIYKKNILFLQSYNPTLHKRIIEFEKLNIETKFIDFDNNHFELITENRKIYNCDPFFDAKHRADNIESSQAIFSMIVDEIKTKNYYEKDEISAHNFVQEFLDLKSKNDFPTIKKFIFIGTLLGVHINDIHRKLNHESYCIVEPSFETFRLSLFLTDYTELVQTAKIFFIIEENDFNFKNILYSFLEYKFSQNHFIKFELASEAEFFLVEKLKNIITSYNPFIHAFSEDIIDLQRGFSNFNISYNGILNYTNLSLFEKEHVLILGAGPSLEENQQFIKENHKKFFIIASAASLKRLEKIDVIADMIVSIDKKDEIKKQFEVDEKYYKNSIILLSTKTNLNLFKKLNSKKTYLIQTSLEIFKNFGEINAVSVGDFMCKFALKCKAKNIYLLGIDAAFNTNKSHDSLHTSQFEINQDDLMKVKGNFKTNVQTNMTYAEIINSFSAISLPNNSNIYNLSENGAFLPNTIPTKIENIDINTLKNTMDKNNLLLESLLTNSSSKKIHVETINFYKQEFEIFQKIKKNIINVEFDDYIIELHNGNQNSFICDIFYRYLKLINPYVTSIKHKNSLIIKKNQLYLLVEKIDSFFRTIH